MLSVTDTSIFARSSEDGRQLLAYAMSLNAQNEVAMVLPLPVPPASTVRFIDLSTYPTLFTDLWNGVFYPPIARAMQGTRADKVVGLLDVVQVGSYEASFVPGVADFERLDPRFRLPAGTWDKLPQYQDWGFAVFKLKPGKQVVHPMAFEFPRRNPRELFFPTVHIHDGLVHAQADFDHHLYCQARTEEKFALATWAESEQPASVFVDGQKDQGLVNPAKHVYGQRLHGLLKNEDKVLSF